MTVKGLTAHLQTVHASDRFEAAFPADASTEALPPRPDAITGGMRASPPPAKARSVAHSWASKRQGCLT